MMKILVNNSNLGRNDMGWSKDSIQIKFTLLCMQSCFVVYHHRYICLN